MRAFALTCLLLGLLQIGLALAYDQTLGLITAPQTGSLYRKSHDDWWRTNDDARQGAIRVADQDPVAGPSAEAVSAAASRQDGNASSPVRVRLAIGGVVTALISLSLLSRTGRDRHSQALSLFAGPVRALALAVVVAGINIASMNGALKSTHPPAWTAINREFFAHWRPAWDNDRIWARENRKFYSLVVEQDVELTNDLFRTARMLHAQRVAATGHLVTAGNAFVQFALCVGLWRMRATRRPPTTSPNPPRHTTPAPPPPPQTPAT